MGQVELREYVHGPGEWKTVVYTDEKILETFPDNYESLVNKLLRRAQAAEAEIERLRAALNPECTRCWLPQRVENGATVYCDRCVDDILAERDEAREAAKFLQSRIALIMRTEPHPHERWPWLKEE